MDLPHLISPMPRQLIIHIGTGKTGSTAIQAALGRHAEELRAHHMFYWGLNLERAAPAPLFAWQTQYGIGILQRTKPDEARKQLNEALRAAIEGLPEDGVVIWSNESIYERPQVYLPVIKSLSADYVLDLKVVCFARNHRAYIDSAYKQWGIKHKTYRGPIQSFEGWTQRNVDFLSYGRKISTWDSQLQERFQLINYDSIGDVLQCFLALLPAQASAIVATSGRRSNPSPNRSLLTFFALFNNQSPHPVPPREAEEIIRRYHLQDSNHQLIDLSDLHPDAQLLDAAEALLSEDIARMNSLMSKHHQPLLAAREQGATDGSAQNHRDDNQNVQQEGQQDSPEKDRQDYGSLLSMLLTIILEQGKSIAHLEQALAELQTTRQEP